AGIESLAAQIVRVWDLGVYTDQEALKASASRRDFLEQLLQQAAAKRDQLRPDEPIVIVVDALDEAWTAAGSNVLGLPERLPKGVFVIASRRPVNVALNVSDQHTIKLLAGSEENERDMRGYLQDTGRRLGLNDYSQDDRLTISDFVERLVRKSRGLW